MTASALGSGRRGEQQAGSGCNWEEAPSFAGELDLESSVTLGCCQLGGKAVTWQPEEAPSSLWTRSLKCLSDTHGRRRRISGSGRRSTWMDVRACGRTSSPGAACSEERSQSRRAALRCLGGGRGAGQEAQLGALTPQKRRCFRGSRVSHASAAGSLVRCPLHSPSDAAAPGMGAQTRPRGDGLECWRPCWGGAEECSGRRQVCSHGHEFELDFLFH